MRRLGITLLLLAGTVASALPGQTQRSGRFVILECVLERDAHRGGDRLSALDRTVDYAVRRGYNARIVDSDDVRGFAPGVMAAVIGPFSTYAEAAAVNRKFRARYRTSYVKRGVWNGNVYSHDDC